MLFIFNKNKIISYTVAAGIVVTLFLFSMTFTPNMEVELIPVSSNVNNQITNYKIENNN